MFLPRVFFLFKFVPISRSKGINREGFEIKRKKKNAMHHMLHECPQARAAFRQPSQALLSPSWVVVARRVVRIRVQLREKDEGLKVPTEKWSEKEKIRDAK